MATVLSSIERFGSLPIAHPRSLRFRSDALLLLAALLWGSAFVPQRVAAGHLGPFLFNGLRFLLGAMLLLPWVRPFRLPSKNFFGWALIAGSLLVGASVCQQAGMKWTTAGNAGFLTGLYVVLVPVVMFVGWRQRIVWQTWAGAVIATAGVLLLGVDDHFRMHLGDILELAGAVLWALHVVIVGRAVKHVEVLLFSVGQYFVAGALNLVIGLVLEADTLPGLAVCWWTVVYVGVVSVSIGYTLQAVGQKQRARGRRSHYSQHGSRLRGPFRIPAAPRSADRAAVARLHIDPCGHAVQFKEAAKP